MVNWTAVNNMTALLQVANENTGSWFWTGMLYMIWIVILITSSAFGFEVALLTASFICFIIGLLMVYLGVVAWTWLLPFIGLMLFMFLYIMWNRKN